VLEPPIAKSIRFAEAPAVGRSILATARTSKGAQAYRQHARQLLAAQTLDLTEPKATTTTASR
jgi:chromosome partitioning protein